MEMDPLGARTHIPETIPKTQRNKRIKRTESTERTDAKITRSSRVLKDPTPGVGHNPASARSGSGEGSEKIEGAAHQIIDQGKENRPPVTKGRRNSRSRNPERSPLATLTDLGGQMLGKTRAVLETGVGFFAKKSTRVVADVTRVTEQAITEIAQASELVVGTVNPLVAQASEEAEQAITVCTETFRNLAPQLTELIEDAIKGIASTEIASEECASKLLVELKTMAQTALDKGQAVAEFSKEQLEYIAQELTTDTLQEGLKALQEALTEMGGQALVFSAKNLTEPVWNELSNHIKTIAQGIQNFSLDTRKKLAEKITDITTEIISSQVLVNLAKKVVMSPNKYVRKTIRIVLKQVLHGVMWQWLANLLISVCTWLLRNCECLTNWVFSRFQSMCKKPEGVIYKAIYEKLAPEPPPVASGKKIVNAPPQEITIFDSLKNMNEICLAVKDLHIKYFPVLVTKVQ